LHHNLGIDPPLFGAYILFTLTRISSRHQSGITELDNRKSRTRAIKNLMTGRLTPPSPKGGYNLRNTASEWNVYRTRFLIKAKQLTEPLVFVDFFGREHRGGVGDYLVESSDGTRRIAPREIFEDIYVVMDSAGPPSSLAQEGIVHGSGVPERAMDRAVKDRALAASALAARTVEKHYGHAHPSR
jgi:hypothetical protein